MSASSDEVCEELGRVQACPRGPILNRIGPRDRGNLVDAPSCTTFGTPTRPSLDPDAYLDVCAAPEDSPKVDVTKVLTGPILQG